MLDKTITFHDKRQYNTEANNAFLTVAIFIYGFIGVIMLISILNIINTMNTSIASKTKYLGTIRAIGMSGKQLNRIVFAQAVVYSFTGCFIGCLLGILLQWKLLSFLAAAWSFPGCQAMIIFGVCILTSVLSVIAPLKRIRRRGISETITSL